MKRYCYFFIALAALLVIAASARPVMAGTIIASGDTYSNQSQADTSQNAKGLHCGENWGGSNGETDDYLWFQLGSTPVVSATFKVYQAQPTPQSDGNVYWLATQDALTVPNAPYTELNTTWNHSPSAGPPPKWSWLGGATHSFYVAENTQAWFSLDCTEFYNNNLGKYIVITNWAQDTTYSGGMTFEDRENTLGTGNTPRIEFTPEPTSLVSLAALCFAQSLRKRRR